MNKRDTVAMTLRAMITDGRLAPGDLLPTRAQLQDRFGAGPVTIHHAISALADEGFVVSQRGARTRVAPAPPHQSCYGLVLTPAHERLTGRVNRFQQAMVMAAEQFNDQQAHRQVRIYAGVDGHADCEDYRRLIDDVEHVRLAGVLFVFRPHELAGHSVVEQSRVPMVDIGQLRGDELSVGRSHPVDLGWERAAREMAGCLARAGRTTAAYLGHPGNFRDMEAIAAAFAEGGVALPPMWRARCALAAPEGARDLARLIFSYPADRRPDALVVADDNLLEHAIAGVLEAGCRVPEDVTVVSNWNFPLPAPQMVPFHRVGHDAREVLAQCFELCESLAGQPDRNAPAAADQVDWNQTLKCRPVCAG